MQLTPLRSMVGSRGAGCREIESHREREKPSGVGQGQRLKRRHKISKYRLETRIEFCSPASKLIYKYRISFVTDLQDNSRMGFLSINCNCNHNKIYVIQPFDDLMLLSQDNNVYLCLQGQL